MNQRPMVGVGVIVTRDEGRKVLLGKRKGAHGAGTWSFPGGHLEYGESSHDCAARELFEETGLQAHQLAEQVRHTNDFMPDEDKHYITLYVRAWVTEKDEPVVREPDKCEEWGWFDWDHLPEKLFLAVRNLKFSGYHPED